jgi:acyl-CoA reductase-like NAD-dependent aldehyde dehydrogenase
LSDHLGTREIQHSIDGRHTASITRQTFAQRSFQNNLPSARVAEGGDADLDAAVTAARSALHGEWGRTSDGGANYGLLIGQKHRDKVLSYHAEAIVEGATLVTTAQCVHQASRT